MNIKSIRGAVDPVTWIVIGLIVVGGVTYKKMFEPGRNRKVAQQVAAASEAAEKEAKRAREEAELAKKVAAEQIAAHTKEIELRNQMDQNAANFSAQGKAILEADPNPSPHTLIAIGMFDSIEASLGARFTPQQRAEFVKRVVPLLQHNAEVEKALANEKARAMALAAEKDAVHQRALAADAKLTEVSQQLAVTASDSAKYATNAAGLAEKNKRWADGEMTLLGRIKALIAFSIVVMIIAGGIYWRLHGTTQTLHDAVAFSEEAKKEAFAVAGDAEKRLEEWWSGDHAAKARLEKIKTKLRM